ncbi:MAG: ABC transporter substrate-binding protein [Proteobacteria bacterium]|nr:ABC transporter substrate-binding protein [Pseudomonadota bacterium]
MVRLRAFFRIILTSLLLAGALSAPASAKSEGPRAETFINTLSTKAIALVSDKVASSDTKRQGFAELLKQGFDMDWIGQFVLGRNWNIATPEQRVEYLQLFEEIIVYTYSKRFNDYSGQQVRVDDHQLGKRRYVFVKSRIFDPARAGSGINVTWRLLPKTESFKIVDVVIEGVSMGITQRNEYNSVIQRNGGKIDALVEAMRDNLENLRSAP